MDATNQTEPKAGYQLSGDTTRLAAIKRLKKQQEQGNAVSLIPPSKKA